MRALQTDTQSAGGYSDPHSDILAGLFRRAWRAGNRVAIGPAYVLEASEARVAPFGISCAIPTSPDGSSKAFAVKRHASIGGSTQDFAGFASSTIVLEDRVTLHCLSRADPRMPQGFGLGVTGGVRVRASK